ncbi:MAG: hypothetical protein AAGD33_15625 [Actinomycetota bacterium]
MVPRLSIDTGDLTTASVSFTDVDLDTRIRVVEALARQLCGRLPVPVDVLDSLDLPLTDSVVAVHVECGLDRAEIACDGTSRLSITLIGSLPIPDVSELFDLPTRELINVFFDLRTDGRALQLVGDLR